MQVCGGLAELGQRMTGCQEVERFPLVLEGALGTAVEGGPGAIQCHSGVTPSLQDSLLGFGLLGPGCDSPLHRLPVWLS